MSSFFLLFLLILVVVVIIATANSKRWAELLFSVVGIGAIGALLDGMNAMQNARDVAGAILIATGLLCLLGLAFAIKVFQPRP